MEKVSEKGLFSGRKGGGGVEEVADGDFEFFDVDALVEENLAGTGVVGHQKARGQGGG